MIECPEHDSYQQHTYAPNHETMTSLLERTAPEHAAPDPRLSGGFYMNKMASMKYLYFIIKFSLPCIQSVQGGGMTACNHAELLSKITSAVIIIFF